MASPFTPKDFTPSYPTNSIDVYEQIVDECAPYDQIDSWKERIKAGAPRYCKRRLHVMIRGGRKASRYGRPEWAGGRDPGLYPPDPEEAPATRGGGPRSASGGRPPRDERPQTIPGTRFGEKEGQRTRERLDGPNPYFDARTQPYGARGNQGIDLKPRMPFTPIPGTSFTVRLAEFNMDNGELEIIKKDLADEETRYRIKFLVRRPTVFEDTTFTVFKTGNHLFLKMASSAEQQQIERTTQAIRTLMGTGNFIVPEYPEILVNAGMDKEIAYLLLRRVEAGREYERPTKKQPKTLLQRIASAKPTTTAARSATLGAFRLMFDRLPGRGQAEIPNLQVPSGRFYDMKVTGRSFDTFTAKDTINLGLYLQADNFLSLRSGVTTAQFKLALERMALDPTGFDNEDDYFDALLDQLKSLKEVEFIDDDLIDELTNLVDEIEVKVWWQYTGSSPERLDCNREGIETAVDRYINYLEATERRRFKRDTDGPVFIQRFFNEAVTRSLERLSIFGLLGGKPPNLTIQIAQVDEATRQIIPRQFIKFQTPLIGVEHSNIVTVEARGRRIKYENLGNVPLEELPQVLVRLARRKARKGRVLKPVQAQKAKMNGLPLPIEESETFTVATQPDASEDAQLKFVFDSLYPSDPSKKPELTLVRGSSRRVYWPILRYKVVFDQQAQKLKKVKRPVGLKEVDIDQAKSWLRVNEETKAKRAQSGFVGFGTPPTTQVRKAPAPLVLLQNPNSSAPAAKKVNPMSDEESWMYQYSKDPFGAEASIPASRRNPRRKRKAAPGKAAMLRKIGLRTQELVAKGHDRSSAMKRAWAEARGKKAAVPRKAVRKAAPKARKAAHSRKASHSRSRARRNVSALQNPWYDSLFLPDQTMVRPALVESATPWSDDTMVRSSLVRGPYGATENPRRKKRSRARRNDGDTLLFSPEIDMWEHHPVYEQTIGQFSTDEAFTHGIQPVNRRNPRRRRKQRKD